MHVEQTSAFLNLPREIRYHILEHATVYTAQPPQGPHIYSRWLRIHHQATVESLRSGIPIRRELKEIFPRLARTRDLLFICRQVHEELLYLTQSDVKERPTAHLDVLVSGYRFYPTWTRIPALFNARRSLDLVVTLRIMSGEAFWPQFFEQAERHLAPGISVILVLIDGLRGYVSALQKREGYTHHSTLNHVTLEVHCRDQYTSGGFDRVQAAIASYMNIATELQAESPIFETYSIANIDPTTGSISESSTFQEANIRA